MSAAASDPTPGRWPFILPAAGLALAAAVAATGASDQFVWHFVRATGIVAYLVLLAAMVAGLLVSSRTLPAGGARLDGYEVHNFASLLALLFAGSHAVSLLLDSYVGFSPRQVLLPFASSYRPTAVSLGILALYLSLAVYVSFWLRSLLTYRVWRILHFASFGCFILATYHGLLAGTDGREPVLLAMYFGGMALVLALILFRLVTADRRQS